MIDKMKAYLSPNRFIPNDYEELTALELIGKQNAKIDEVVEGTNINTEGIRKKLNRDEYYDDMEGNRKLNQQGNFTGSWHGISRPEYSVPGNAESVIRNANDIQYLRFNKNLVNTKVKLKNKRPIHFISFGDSLTKGSAANGNGEVTTKNPFPLAIENYLKFIHDYEDITHENCGLPGHPVESILNEILNKDLTHVDFITVMFGTNDVLQGKDLTVIGGAIQQVIDKCCQSQTELILMTIPPVFSQFRHEVKYVNGIIKSFSDKCLIVDVNKEMRQLQHFKYPTHAIFPDLVHLSDDKYKLIADIIIKSVFNEDVITEVGLYGVGDSFIKTNGNVGLANTSLQQTFMGSGFISNKKNEYIRILVYCESQCNIKWWYPVGDGGGVANIRLNGSVVKTVDFYNQSTIGDNVFYLNCDMGMNVIEVQSSDITSKNEGHACFINAIEKTREEWRMDCELLNGFENYGGFSSNVMSSKNGDLISLRGIVRITNANIQGPMIRLNHYYSPKKSLLITITGEKKQCICEIDKEGYVKLHNGVISEIGEWISLDGVNFII